MPPPIEVKAQAPLTAAAAATVTRGRAVLRDILDRKDPRLFVVLGPCSIHDPKAAHDYAARLGALADEVADTLVLVMRVYFEKPRTSTGWKGYINDPHMDDSFRIDEGMMAARRLLLDFAEMGLPTGSEALDPLSPQYLARPDQLVRDRRAHDRVADAPRDGERPVDARGLQERHRRQPRGRPERHPLGRQPAQLPRHQPLWQDRDRPHLRQPLRSPGAAGRGRPSQLRHGERAAGRGQPAQGRAAREHRHRLLPLQLAEGPRPPAAGLPRLRAPDQGGQPLDRRHDAGEPPLRRQPAYPRRPVPAALRGVGHRRLHRLGHDRGGHPPRAQRAARAARRTAGLSRSARGVGLGPYPLSDCGFRPRRACDHGQPRPPHRVNGATFRVSDRQFHRSPSAASEYRCRSPAPPSSTGAPSPNRVSTWFAATRPAFLTASVMPVLVGLAFSWREHGTINFELALATLLNIVLIHAGANVLNDYYDAKNGTDGANTARIFPFSGGSRFIQNGVMTPRQTFWLGAVLLGSGAFLGLLMAAVAGAFVLAIGAARGAARDLLLGATVPRVPGPR